MEKLAKLSAMYNLVAKIDKSEEYRRKIYTRLQAAFIVLFDEKDPNERYKLLQYCMAQLCRLACESEGVRSIVKTL